MEVCHPSLDGTGLILQLRRKSPSLPCVAIAHTNDEDTRSFLEGQGLLRVLEPSVTMDVVDEAMNEVLDEARSLGFQGHLQRISLIELIQLYCATVKTGRLDILHWGKRGAVYFARGKLLHAVQEELEGPEAFYRLVGWDSGSFQVEFGVLPSIDTLSHSSLHALLIEAIRRQDEAHARGRSQRSSHPFGQPVKGRAIKPPALELEAEASLQHRPSVLKAPVVNDLFAIDGVEGVLVVNRNGVVLQTEEVDESEETLGTLAAFLGSSCESAQRIIGADRFTSASVVERSQRKLLVVNTRNFYVGIIGSTHTQTDTLREDVLACIRRAARTKQGRRAEPAGANQRLESDS